MFYLLFFFQGKKIPLLFLCETGKSESEVYVRVCMYVGVYRNIFSTVP